MKVIFPLFLIIVSAFFCCGKQNPEKDIIVLTGKIVDAKSKKGIANAGVSVIGSNVGTVSNDDGVFRLKINKRLAEGGLKTECPGYYNTVLSWDYLTAAGKGGLQITMRPIGKLLREVVVKSGDPYEIVKGALAKISDNYPLKNNMFSAFYREVIQKGKRYVAVSEAIMGVYKTPYNRLTTAGERVNIVKGRKLSRQTGSDTLAVKIIGGPTMPVFLDVVKNQGLLFQDVEMDYYDFEMLGSASIDNRLQFVIRFKPKVIVDYALCHGKLYIDQETLSFSRAEMNVDVSNRDKATAAILRRKPRGLHFKPQEISFTVAYKDFDGLTYLNYISSKTRFKCDWKRRLFSSGYTAFAEMVMVDRDDNPSVKISRRDAFGKDDVFDDKVELYWDRDFWNDYNIIEPTVSLEKAVDKLKSKKGVASPI